MPVRARRATTQSGGLEVLNAHLTAQVARPSVTRPGIPPDLEAIVLRLLAKNSADRFSDAEALEKALAACRGCGEWKDADASQWWESGDAAPGRADAVRMPSVATSAMGLTVAATSP